MEQHVLAEGKLLQLTTSRVNLATTNKNKQSFALRLQIKKNSNLQKLRAAPQGGAAT
ncbi:MAG: hypothetical protein PHE88_00870 [Elusimicrobia bacterium]|nr:hypothetical protein [Elusimicrobiota bacterium]